MQQREPKTILIKEINRKKENPSFTVKFWSVWADSIWWKNLHQQKFCLFTPPESLKAYRYNQVPVCSLDPFVRLTCLARQILTISFKK